MATWWCRRSRGSASPSTRRRSSATRSADAAAQLLREPAELLLLGGGERGERLADGRHVAGKDSGDEAAALGGEADCHVTAIVAPPFGAHQTPTLEVFEHGRDVATSQQLPTA